MNWDCQYLLKQKSLIHPFYINNLCFITLFPDDWEKACRHLKKAADTDNVETDAEEIKRTIKKPGRFCDGSDGDDECKWKLKFWNILVCDGFPVGFKLQ